VDVDAYCREIEAHLCRRNAGHLVRVVGPAFLMVAGWAGQGIPLKVACLGIDRTVDRRKARGPSRRPLRVEFCEADVLDAYNEWRRAVGIGTAGGGSLRQPGEPAGPEQEGERPKSGPSLRAHLDRVATRLTDRLADGSLRGPLESRVERLMAELGELRGGSRSARGEARAALVSRLQALDDELMAGAWEAAPREVRDALRLEAEQDVAGFRGRMTSEDYARAVDGGATRLLRERLKLPDLTY
jgi:hypothetical protein